MESDADDNQRSGRQAATSQTHKKADEQSAKDRGGSNERQQSIDEMISYVEFRLEQLRAWERKLCGK